MYQYREEILPGAFRHPRHAVLQGAISDGMTGLTLLFSSSSFDWKVEEKHLNSGRRHRRS